MDGRRLLSSYRHLLGQLMMARELTREQWGEVGMGMDVADRAERELGMVESVLRDFRSNEPTKRLMRVLQNISAVRIQRTWRAKEARIATVPLCMRKYMLIRAGELGVSNVAHIRTMSAGVITTASGGVGAGGKPLPLRGSVAWVHGRIEDRADVREQDGGGPVERRAPSPAARLPRTHLRQVPRQVRRLGRPGVCLLGA